MRSWMIGIVMGLLPVPLLARLPALSVALALVCTGLLLLRSASGPGRFCSGLALGCAIGLIEGHLLLQSRLPAECAMVPLRVSGQVAALPRTSQMAGDVSRQRFEFTVASISPVRCQGPVRLLLSYYGPQRITPGQWWNFELALKLPWGLANPGSFNMQAWFAQTGIDAVGSIPTAGAQLIADQPGLLTWHHRLRLAISERIAGLSLGPDVVAILRAITVADKSGIDSRLWSLLQQFGINHLLVISGLHIGLVAGAGYLLGGLGLRLLLLAGCSPAWLPGALALALACVYAALAGFSLSTQRALCMLLCFITAGLVGRSSTSANNLLLAAVLVLVLNPLAVLGSGMWLSFGSVAALLWLVNWQRGSNRWRRLLWTHVFMSLVMLPMGAFWFGGSSMVAGLANLLMVPLVGLLVVPLALLAVLSMYVAPVLEQLLWALAAWPLEQLLPLARQIAESGDSWLYRQLAADLPDVLLAVIGVALVIVPAGPAVRLLAGLCVLPLLVLPAPAPAPADDLVRVTVLDVGQGTAMLVQAGDRALLYDTGGGDPAGNNMASAVILPYLRRAGITSLDTLVVSHPDTDHSAGAATLLQALQIDRFLYGIQLPGLTSGRNCIAGQAWRWPTGQRFQVLSPALESPLSSNNSSCVLQIDTGSRRLLLAGDIEASRERELVRYWGDQLRSDWLLVAHHGSQTSSFYSWLKTVQPRAAVFSNGYANRFGHPHARVMERVRSTGARVYSTATAGALTFDFRGHQPVIVQEYRQQVPRFWM